MHQPRSDLRPGLTLGIAGTHFGRLDTWWHEAKPWVDYLAHCKYLLQRGDYVADLVRLSHDDMDIFFAETYPALPDGLDVDTMSLQRFLRTVVADGRLQVPGGTSYAAVVVPNSWAANLDVLQHLESVRRAGIPVIGPPPLAPAGLQDLREHAREWRKAVARIWPDATGGARAQASGLAALGQLAPDVRLTGKSPDRIHWLHRRTDGADIYFLPNQGTEPQSFTADFRIGHRAVELWDPVSGTTEINVVYREQDGRTALPLRLPAAGSLFVAFQGTPSGSHVVSVSRPSGATETGAIRVAKGRMLGQVAGNYVLHTSDGHSRTVTLQSPADRVVQPPWHVEFRPAVGAPFDRDFPQLASWANASDESVKYFSGTATYHGEFAVPAEAVRAGTNCEIDLDEVGYLARVTVNGHDLGVVWTNPFFIDVTGCLQAGNNSITIAVTNAWANRVIGDERLPDDVPWRKRGGRDVLEEFPDWYRDPQRLKQRQRATFASSHMYRPDSPLLPGGLIGPVILRFSASLDAQSDNRSLQRRDE